jgi:hypothetical protein
MSITSQIQYIRQAQIDKLKWDACIRSATHRLIYNYSWYLDIMARHWDALVLNDYEAVMPLTWNRKFGIYYLYQPFFTAQTGITGNANDSAITDAFVQAIPAQFKYVDINLDENNNTVKFDDACLKRINMQLNLSKNYVETCKTYHRLATRMLRKAREKEVYVEANTLIRENISFYRQQYNQLKISSSEYERLIHLFETASLTNNVISLAAKQNNRLLGMYLLLQDEHYVYSVIGGSSAEGKENGAFYMLTDYAIKCVCGSDRLFRFEGSDLPGIAHFNQQFGAKPFYYNHLKINRLPFLLQSFKK